MCQCNAMYLSPSPSWFPTPEELEKAWLERQKRVPTEAMVEAMVEVMVVLRVVDPTSVIVVLDTYTTPDI